MRREEKKMLMNSNEYLQIIETIKGQIKGAQYQAALNVNRELIMLYYHIGKVINEHKTWGSKFIENLAADIRISFPNVKGYSVRNLKYMAKFAETYPDEVFVQTVSAQIPWSHNIAILEKIKDSERRICYIEKRITMRIFLCKNKEPCTCKALKSVFIQFRRTYSV